MANRYHALLVMAHIPPWSRCVVKDRSDAGGRLRKSRARQSWSEKFDFDLNWEYKTARLSAIAMPTNAAKIGNELQRIYRAELASLMELGLRLIRTLPTRNPKLAQLVFISMAQRLFLLLEDIHQTFQTKLDSGYFTTALLTRGLMEAATTLLVLTKDTTGELLSAFIETAEHESRRRRNGLARMQSVRNPDVAKAAQNETRLADTVLVALQDIKSHAALPKTQKRFPKMEDRCSMLGEVWQFMYEATYRELCEAVHGSFLKIPHAPSLAIRAPDQGAAVLYEHSRATAYAVEFWGLSILEVCSDHPDVKAVETFHGLLRDLLAKVSAIQDQFSRETASHTISF
jgi:hypothetical protein